VSYTVH